MRLDDTNNTASNNQKDLKGPHRVFVTKEAFEAPTTGIEAADMLCQQAADAASLGGVWRAWLSDESEDALTRISGEGPWRNLADEELFVDRAQLEKAPSKAINMDETKAMVDGFVWTGTKLGGMRSDKHCGSWSSAFGFASMGIMTAGDSWTFDMDGRCSAKARFYCFEQP